MMNFRCCSEITELKTTENINDENIIDENKINQKNMSGFITTKNKVSKIKRHLKLQHVQTSPPTWVSIPPPDTKRLIFFNLSPPKLTY